MSSGECEQAYGVLPCSTTASGSAFLCLFFGYSVLKGAELIGEGSELLLNILHPGLVGGLLALVLAGCGSGQETPEPEQREATTAAEPTPSASASSSTVGSTA